MKKFLIIIISILFILTIIVYSMVAYTIFNSGSQTTQGDISKSTSKQTSEDINGVANKYSAMSTQIFAYKDNIYFSQWGDEKSIYKMKSSGCEFIKVNDIPSRIVTIENDWIYYQYDKIGGSEDNDDLYKMKIDGTQNTKIKELETMTSLLINNGWIYSVEYDQDYKKRTLYRSSLDGNPSKRILVHDNIFKIYVDNDNIYYQRISPDYKTISDNGIYKLDVDQDYLSCIVPGSFFKDINVKNDWIYFSKIPTLNKSSKNGLYKIKSDGSELTQLSSLPVVNINVAGDWIYYNVFESDYYEIYKMKLDGSENMKLVYNKNKENGILDFFSIAGDYIFYDKKDGTYMLKTDGSNNEVKIKSIDKKRS